MIPNMDTIIKIIFSVFQILLSSDRWNNTQNTSGIICSRLRLISFIPTDSLDIYTQTDKKNVAIPVTNRFPKIFSVFDEKSQCVRDSPINVTQKISTTERGKRVNIFLIFSFILSRCNSCENFIYLNI